MTKKRKKSLVGWTSIQWSLIRSGDTEIVHSPIMKKKKYVLCPAVKVRITIEEL